MELKDPLSVQTFFWVFLSTASVCTPQKPQWLLCHQFKCFKSWTPHVEFTHSDKPGACQRCVMNGCGRDRFMVYIVYKSNTVMSEERHNWTTTPSETAHIMPWCSPLKQGIMLQKNYTGGWNDLVWSPHLVIIIIIIIIICLYILFTDSKTPCGSFS